MNTTTEPEAWYCTIGDWEGLPHPGNVETWSGQDYTVVNVTHLEHGPECICGKGSMLVTYWPTEWLSTKSKAWQHAQRHREAAKLCQATRDCDLVWSLTYDGPVALASR